MGTGRNGESKKNKTANKMAIVVKPVRTGYLKKKTCVPVTPFVEVTR